MGLDELVNDNKEEDGSEDTEQPSSSNTERVSGQKTLRRSEVDDNRPEKVSVKDDLSVVGCTDCGSCSGGTRVPVNGLAIDHEGKPAYGSLMVCDNIFCEHSLFFYEDPPTEFNRLDVYSDMIEITGGPSIGGW